MTHLFDYVRIGKDSNGQYDFRVSGQLIELEYAEMQKLRAISVVALAQMEEMFSLGVNMRNPASTATPTESK